MLKEEFFTLMNEIREFIGVLTEAGKGMVVLMCFKISKTFKVELEGIRFHC